MKKLAFAAIVILMSWVGMASAQDTIRMTARDVAANYGLQPEFFDDTNALEKYLAAQEQNYGELSHTCATIARSASTMISDLEVDFKDGLVQFDDTHVLTHFQEDRSMLYHLIVKANALSHTYDSLETVRVEQEKKLARERAAAEARRIQAEKEKSLTDTRSEIATRHRAIVATCNNETVTDRNKVKELKDIYYAYLSVYNKYDLNSTQPLDEMLAEDKQLRDFQQHLQDSILGEESYLSQIENFKEEFKVDAAKNPMVYRSYAKLFKKTSVPVTFATLQEYSQYVEKLREIRNVQTQYRLYLEELSRIEAYSENITTIYGKRYSDISSAYKSMVASQDFTPVFVSTKEGTTAIKRLTDFEAVQKQYIANFERLEKIKAKGSQITSECQKIHYDVVVGYEELVDNTNFVANFSNSVGADAYKKRLDEFEHMQQQYDTIIELRNIILSKNDSILNSQYIEKILTKGFKTIKKNETLTPHFVTVMQGQEFLNKLKEFINQEDQFLSVLDDRAILLKNQQEMERRQSAYPNIVKAYKKIDKTFEYLEINNFQDLVRYNATQQKHLDTQEIFLKAVSSADASSYNQQLKRVSDIGKIKLILNIQ